MGYRIKDEIFFNFLILVITIVLFCTASAALFITFAASFTAFAAIFTAFDTSFTAFVFFVEKNA